MDIKQEEKIDKYVDLAVEIKELWKMKSAKVVPVVIGELGTVPKRLKDYLRNKCWNRLGALQRTVLLGSTRILGSEGSLKSEAAFRDLIYIYMMGLKFPALTYLP